MQEVDPGDVRNGWDGPAAGRPRRSLAVPLLVLLLSLAVGMLWWTALEQGRYIRRLEERLDERDEHDQAQDQALVRADRRVDSLRADITLLRIDTGLAIRLHEYQFRHTAAVEREVCWSSDVLQHPIPEDSICPRILERGAIWVGAGDLENLRARRPPANRGGRRAR